MDFFVVIKYIITLIIYCIVKEYNQAMFLIQLQLKYKFKFWQLLELTYY